MCHPPHALRSPLHATPAPLSRRPAPRTPQCGLLVAGALVLVSAAVPYILPLFVPLGCLFVLMRHRYIAASREIKRWEAVTRWVMRSQWVTLF